MTNLQFRLFIDMDNEAFQESETMEVARILRDLVKKLENSSYPIAHFEEEKLRDINGNTVGLVTIEEL